MTGTVTAILGALLLAGASTLGDFIWAHFSLEHRPTYGLIHGTLLCAVIGLYLGLLRKRPVPGAVGGAIIGFGAAAGFYLLARLAGMAAMFPLWMVFWIAFALLDARVLIDHAIRPATIRNALVRGAVAAVASGLAFYAISDIWLDRSPGGPYYGVNFVSWTVAFLPGFLALLAGPARAGR
jgi:hypothetical protein